MTTSDNLARFYRAAYDTSFFAELIFAAQGEDKTQYNHQARILSAWSPLVAGQKKHTVVNTPRQVGLSTAIAITIAHSLLFGFNKSVAFLGINRMGTDTMRKRVEEIMEVAKETMGDNLFAETTQSNQSCVRVGTNRLALVVSGRSLRGHTLTDVFFELSPKTTPDEFSEVMVAHLPALHGRLHIVASGWQRDVERIKLLKPDDFEIIDISHRVCAEAADLHRQQYGDDAFCREFLLVENKGNNMANRLNQT